MIASRRIAALSASLAAAALVAGALAAAPARPTASPWFGTWKLRLKTPGEPPETLVYSDAGGGAMRMAAIEDGSVIVTRFDGRPAADTGDTAARAGKIGKAAHAYALAITATSPISYSWIVWIDGTPRIEGRNRLTDDRRSFIEQSWRIGRPEKVMTFVYERQ